MSPKQQQMVVERLATEALNKKRKQLMEHASVSLISVFLMVLQAEYDWDTDRLNEIVQKINAQMMLIEEKLVTLDDFKDWAKKEGIGGVV